MTAKVILHFGFRCHRWTVIDGPVSRQGRSTYLCRCSCGKKTERWILVSNLINQSSRSCGCIGQEKMLARCTVHGESKRVKLYQVWQGMLARCRNPKHSAYPRYGARGIYVCEEWSDSYVVFHAWSLAHGYTDGLTIDRIDNDGPYSPKNCRWVNRTVQANNKTTNRLLTAWGEQKTLAAWGRDPRCKATVDAIASRLDRGWTPERAISEAVSKRPNRLVRAFGETKTLSGWAKDQRCTVHRKVLARRINRGVKPEEAITMPGRSL